MALDGHIVEDGHARARVSVGTDEVALVPLNYFGDTYVVADVVDGGIVPRGSHPVVLWRSLFGAGLVRYTGRRTDADRPVWELV